MIILKIERRCSFKKVYEIGEDVKFLGNGQKPNVAVHL